MNTLSVIGLSICLVFISIIMHGAEAGTCSSCIADFGKAAGFDKDKLCSAAKTYVECTEEGCKSGVAVAEKAKEAACSAGSIFVNLAVIGLGFTLYMLV